MKKRRLATLLIIAVLSVLLLLSVIQSRSISEDELEIWYLLDDVSEDSLEAMLSDYAQRINRGKLRICFKAFESETMLDEALLKAQPDLLWCRHRKAIALNELSGMNFEPFSSLHFSDSIAQMQGTDSYFFPVGACVPLLVYNEQAINADNISLEELLTTASEYSMQTSRAFLAANSYSLIISSSLASLGTDFHAKLSLDAQEPYYRMLHNMLMDCAYNASALSTAQPALTQVFDGLCMCACVRSTEIPAELPSPYLVTTLPLPSDGRELYIAELMGFAVLNTDKSETVERLFMWFQSTSLDRRLALDSVLVPIDEDGRERAYTPITSLLMSIRNGQKLCFVEANSDFEEDLRQYEKALRISIELLS